jgi:catechol 2,3-dioxygenase-like lactoylglutathione lyase family enzyme
MVTGGVKAERENIRKWFGAGATAVGLGSGLIKKDLVSSGNFDQIAELTYQVKQWIREARDEPLFYGVEHIALYPNEKASCQSILDWYKDIFGFECIEGNSSSILYQKEGRIEVVKEGSDKNIHIAIGVSDFERSMDFLKEKGILLEEPVCKEDVKSVYLADKDPLGNSIHLIWRK